jgi:putative sigma-54 modulation protein
MIKNIKTTGLEMTPAIGSYIDEKLSNIERFINATDESSVIADLEIGKTTEHHKSGEIFKAELNLQIAGQLLRAVATKEDLYAAIDEIKDEMIMQINTSHKKKNTMIRKGGRAVKNLLRGIYPRK